VLWLAPLLSYLIGSLSPAWLAGRIHGTDLRQHGSRNLGATNAGRVLGQKWFLIVFALDVTKGWAPVAVTQWILAHRQGWSPNAAVGLVLAVAAGAVLGHSFTCLHGFRGGKAVATSLGVLIALMPEVAGLSFAVWLVVWLAGWAIARAEKSTAVGPASVAAAVAAPVLHIERASDPWHLPTLALTVFILALATLVVVRHRSNLAKLFRRHAEA
jgi:acyl phosphate:glycerol-3-phosphate acyltransferase